jgi:hypothetical protein
MIDEDRLSDLLRDAVDSIEVPTGGPTGVLEARDRLQPGRRQPPAPPGAHPRRRRRTAIALVGVGLCGAAISVAALHAGGDHARTTSIAAAGGASRRAGVTGNTAKASHTGTSSSAAHTPASASGSTGGSLAFGRATSSTAAGTATGATPVVTGPVSPPISTAPTTVPSSTPIPGLPSKVIKTGSLGLRVTAGDLNASLDRLTALASGLGGYVQQSSADPGASPPSGQVVLRVPVASFEQLVTQAQAVGRMTSLSTSGQDVTSNYVDLNAQIAALEASRAQLLQVLAKAETISDILAVEDQITPIETQIQQLQGQLQVENSETSYGTLTVQVTTSAPSHHHHVTTVHRTGLSKAWAHARHAFTTGLEAVVSASGGIGVFVVCVAVLALIGRIGWRLVRRRLV